MKTVSAILRWRTVAVALGGHCLLFVGLARADVFSNVPEAADYQVVYELPIPVKGVFQGTTPVPYSVNNSGSVASGSFDRVAYYLELVNASSTNWAYASMDTFTTSAVQTGLPHTNYNPVVFQQGISNLAVFSNVQGVKTGSFDRGQIEIWHQTYSASNLTEVFAASDSTCDWGDMIGGTPSGYGSFQVHNPGSRQVVLAYNRWATSSGASDDIGIGNSTGTNPDWTSAGTTTNFTSRKLVVLVRPRCFAVTFTAVPVNQQVVPRSLATSTATVPIAGTETNGGFDKAVLRIYRNGVAYGADSEQVLAYSGGSASFSFNPVIPAELASYTFELYLQTGSTLCLVQRISDVVAGDVFLWYGQSNAQAPMLSGSSDAYLSPWIRTFGMSHDSATVTRAYLFWVQADGDGSLGVPAGVGQWALVVGRKIVDTYGIPVAILNGARGGYSMLKMQRDNANPDALEDGVDVPRPYNRLRYRAIQGKVAASVRGIFFYQGESDKNDVAQHTNGFASLMSSWKLDYPAVERIFEIQLHAAACNVTRELPELRDAQRRFEDVYDTVRVMSVNGLKQHTDDCHHPFTDGYETLGWNVFRQVARDLYGATDTPDIDPPNPDWVEVANAAGDRLRVVLRQPGATVTVNFLSDFRVQGPGLTTNTLPSSATVTNGGIELQYGKNVSAATNLAYLGHKGNAGGWVRNGNRVGLLAFSEPVAAQAAANKWDGGGADALWGTANNWTNNSTPAFGNTLDVYFNTVGAAKLANALGDNRTIRSLTFTADADSNVTIYTADTAANVTARTLTFDTQAATGNAMITVNSGATGSFTIGAGGVGSVALADDLVVAHNGSGGLTINAPITGTKGITKAGTGVLSLTGANTYSGTTTVSNGTLLVNGAIGNSAVTVLTGATLGGTGSIGGAVSVQGGGTLSPGGSIGTLSINNSLTLAGTTLMEINTTNGLSDRIEGLTSLVYGGNLVVSNLAGAGNPPTVGQTFQLFSVPPTFAGRFSSITPALMGGKAWSFNPTNGVLSVVSATAPSPTSMSFSLSGGTISLTWPASHLGWVAQSNAVSVEQSNYWFDIPGSSSVTNLNNTLDPTWTNLFLFYRLRSP